MGERREAVQPVRSFDDLYLQHTAPAFAVVLVAYVLLALLYAVQTPAWQAPDEPAHYNYVAHIAATGTLPVLRAGDYNQEQLDLLLHTRFAPKLSTAPLRYESYQPPLFYLLAAPVFWLTDGNLLALRLLNVVLGALGLFLLYRCLDLVFVRKSLISVGAAAFAALLPMHVAVSAAVNNDVLAELLILSAMLAFLRWMRMAFAREWGSRSAYAHLLLVGLLLGLGMLTKIYAYVLLPLLAGTVMLVTMLALRRDQAAPPARAAVDAGRAALVVVLPALLLALPLWIRNVRLYGLWDILALQWHDQVVVGQPRTLDWIVANGWPEYMERAFSFTFQSFWGVFGWMGVFMDARVYTALLIFTGVIFLGVLWAVVRMISGRPDTDMDRYQVGVLILFGWMIALVLTSYIGYNVKFVQHQGRYFFWGLLPISTVVALGWREVMHPLQGVITGLLAAMLGLAVALAGLMSGGIDKWSLLTIGAIAGALLFQPLLLVATDSLTVTRVPESLVRLLRRRWLQRIQAVLRLLVWSAPFVLLFLLNLSIALTLIPRYLGGL